MDQSNSEPFLHVANDKSVCKICNTHIINKNEERVVKDLSTIRKHAFKWKTLNIPSEDRFADFCYVFDRIKNLTEGKVHDTCRVNIRLKYSKCEKYKIYKELFAENDNGGSYIK